MRLKRYGGGWARGTPRWGWATRAGPAADRAGRPRGRETEQGPEAMSRAREQGSPAADRSGWCLSTRERSWAPWSITLCHNATKICACVCENRQPAQKEDPEGANNHTVCI